MNQNFEIQIPVWMKSAIERKKKIFKKKNNIQVRHRSIE